MKHRRRLFLVLVLLVLILVSGLLLVPPIRWAVIGWLRGWPSLDIPELAFAEPELSWPQYTSDNETKRVLKLSAPGQTEWSTTLDGYVGGVRPPHVVWDADRVYVSHGDGVTALDAQSGNQVWHSPGPQERLCLSKHLLLAVRSGEDEFGKEQGRWLFARSVETGAVVFKVSLEELADPERIRILGDLILVQVQDLNEPVRPNRSLLIDHHGKTRYRLDREIVESLEQGDGHVLLTNEDVVCLDKEGSVRWSSRFSEPLGLTGGGLIRLADGDLLAFLYDGISDSGVQVMRLDGDSDTPVWQTSCSGLLVAHSRYGHQAKVAVVDGKYVKVMSRGSGGDFVELLDLQSGSCLRRVQSNRGLRPGWLERLSSWLGL